MNAYRDTIDYSYEPLPRSEELVHEFLDASVKRKGDERESYFLRETMLSLVRLLKSEQLLDIRQNVNKLVPSSLRPKPVRRSRGQRSPFNHSGQSDLLLSRPD